MLDFTEFTVNIIKATIITSYNYLHVSGEQKNRVKSDFKTFIKLAIDASLFSIVMALEHNIFKKLTTYDRRCLIICIYINKSYNR